MNVALKSIKSEFSAFRKSKPGVTGKRLRYPEKLQLMLVEAKSEGVPYQDLSEASGLSEGGLTKIISRHKNGTPAKKSATVKLVPSLKSGSAAKKNSTSAAKSVPKTKTASLTKKTAKPAVKTKTSSKVAATAKTSEAVTKSKPVAEQTPAKKRGRPSNASKEASLQVAAAQPKPRGRPPIAAKTAPASKMPDSGKSSAKKVIGKTAKSSTDAVAVQRGHTQKAASSLKKNHSQPGHISIGVTTPAGETYTLSLLPKDLRKVLGELPGV